ncbi:PilZ domain-containing protein [Colwellia sp. E2M01]|uniref:PilZ domain-containing protein n=1 Tax=Colwellia sp. E2M01 TaxID=2841561 RepID=UPI001C09B9D1|nr:PilZ domain-containing protein [Colwellia sp. E2M01]MBU2871577.1 PilZ domain-containing protein [Colwellia sp. E2M01]
MNTASLQTKLAQYDEFFAISHSFSVNITAINDDVDFDQFMARIPMPFKLATEMSSIDQSALRSIQNLGNSAAQLVSFLNQQSQKIDLLISYILSQQDNEQHRYEGLAFGGGGIKFTTRNAFNIGQLLELKVFLLEHNCAIYCYGEVLEAEVNDQQTIHKIIFHFIREEDRETLVRASLHEQSKQLQKLAKLRNQDKEI